MRIDIKLYNSKYGDAFSRKIRNLDLFTRVISEHGWKFELDRNSVTNSPLKKLHLCKKDGTILENAGDLFLRWVKGECLESLGI